MKKWHIKAEYDKNKNLLDTLMNIRGITGEKEINDFLNPLDVSLMDCSVFSDMKKTVERINSAINKNEHILIWGDFDADGVTSTALLYKTLKKLGANFDYIIPDRETMGHGLNSKCLLPYVAKKKLKVLITVDCGISNNKEISLLKGLGVDVIITDHHSAPDSLPTAYSILNPKAPDSLDSSLNVGQINTLADLAGVGVAYKLACGLLKDDTDDALKDELLCLACVGTIADVVPLLGENRIITAKGLKLINEGKHKGIELLFKNNNKNSDITSYDIAFILAPRINAAGRLGSPVEAFELLTEKNENKLKLTIKELDNYNKIRQSLCDKTLEEASQIIANNKNFNNEKAVVLFHPDWHIGIIGIVASKIAEKYLKPTFLLTKDDKNQARCSIRGVKGYNIHKILEVNQDLFSGFGGHSMAGGFSFDLETKTFDEVKNAILKTVEDSYDETVENNNLEIDVELDTNDVNCELIQIISKLEPTGQGNQAPVFAIKETVLSFKKPMGKDNNHIMFRCKKNEKELNGVWWRHPEIDFSVGQKIDVAFCARLNTFNGEEFVRLDTVDMAGEIQKNEYKIFDHRQKIDILNQISDYLKNPPFDIGIWAKKSKTVSELKEFEPIYSKIITHNGSHRGLMFFDYPSNIEDFTEVLKTTGATKIHLMKENFNQNIEYYIKQIIGMLKYASSNKNGAICTKMIAELVGLSENFIRITLEILETLNSVEILDINKISFINPPSFDKFYKNTMFELLNEEFNKICEFKNYLANTKAEEIQELICTILH